MADMKKMFAAFTKFMTPSKKTSAAVPAAPVKAAKAAAAKAAAKPAKKAVKGNVNAKVNMAAAAKAALKMKISPDLMTAADCKALGISCRTLFDECGGAKRFGRKYDDDCF